MPLSQTGSYSHTYIGNPMS
ncbi:hypothetical protein F383_36148 [Gossypium arboreum]|uniref:Uncharacterized protein n=1 Tax=Gossypium arboreum TaxID=29729 RepID=A0A0B0ND92_GOSAR|nr:hypothetical protein F383_36148 [Gossypium arboreum]